ncbi:hypothetical protein POLUDNITSA_00640 [Brevundimonas phage vB_BpoS-Poludnitsa]|nr:hypothetical protein POLUDNITSA_00640 [Brevundimonas phage vB_BpoS-Poludnitsa]
MTDRPILKDVKLSDLTREAMASPAATERAFAAAIDRARKSGKKVTVRVAYPEPRRSVR